MPISDQIVCSLNYQKACMSMELSPRVSAGIFLQCLFMHVRLLFIASLRQKISISIFPYFIYVDVNSENPHSHRKTNFVRAGSLNSLIYFWVVCQSDLSPKIIFQLLLLELSLKRKKERIRKLVVVVHACSSSYPGGWVRSITSSRSSLAT